MFGIHSKNEALALAETLIGIFTVTFLGQVIVFGNAVFDTSGSEWKAAAASGAAAVVVAARNWLSSRYTEYGRHPVEDDRFDVFGDEEG
jgi:hypothetical protein